MEDTHADFKTDRNSSEAMTTSEAEFVSAKPSLPLSFKIALLGFGALRTLTNGFVLAIIYMSGRSNMSASTVHIANHTTLERPPFS